MAEIVTLAQAKQSMRIAHDTEDADLVLRLSAAHDLVLRYVGQRRTDNEAWQTEVAAWTTTTAPDVVKAAILYLFGESVRFRGDDADAPADGLLPGRVRMWLDLLRDPTLA